MSKTMTETVEAINIQIRELMRQRDELENAEFHSTVLPQLMDLLGKTFAYRNNSYSCPEKRSDYWDVFRKVVRVVESENGVWIVSEECSIDKNAKPSITLEATFRRHAGMDNGWKRCSVEEYEQMRSAVMVAIYSPDAYAAKLSAE